MTVIKRYANRKLYNTEAKRYITLEGIADLIRQGEEVQVVDHETGGDITALIQAQTILELERKLTGGLPRSVLTNLVRTGSTRLNQLREVFTPAGWKERVDLAIERRMQTLIRRGEIAEEEGLSLLDNLLAAAEPDEFEGVTKKDLERALNQRGVPTRAELERLQGRVQALSAELAQLSDHHVPRRRHKPRPNARKAVRRKSSN